MKTLAALMLLLGLSSTMLLAELRLPEIGGVVSLPEGFEYFQKQGIDSSIGLFKKDKAEIRFDFGRLAGVYVDAMVEVLGAEKAVSIVRNSSMTIAGHPIKILVYSRGGVKGAIISYPDSRGNFFCKYKDEGELADFFALALSFRPDQKTAESGTGQAATHSETTSEAGDKPQADSEGRTR